MELTKIGLSIKLARKQAHLTQQELAEKIGKTTSSIRKYEKGLTQIPIDVVDRIATALNVPLVRLMPDIRWDDWQNTESSKELERQANAFNAIITILISVYELVEEKSAFTKSDWEQPYWIVGKGEKSFILFENDIQALCDATTGMLFPLVARLKDTRPEQDIIDEIYDMEGLPSISELEEKVTALTNAANDTEAESVRVFEAARTRDNIPPKISEMSPEKIKRIEDAPDAEEI